MPPCSSPPGVSNGFFVIAKGTYGDGDQISYYCKMGYELTGAVTRSCDGATGSWSGTTPKCTAATTTTSATTTTESTAKITVAALVVIPSVVLSLLVISLVVLYSIKYLHCQEGCRKQKLWFDGDEYTQDGVWFACCRNSFVFCCQLILCEKCQKVQPSRNDQSNVCWKNRNGTLASNTGSRSPPSRTFSGSVWSSPGDLEGEGHWKPSLKSLPETSQTTLSDI
ncbi:uncharacterized protein LOC111110157 [Crassostrea virginica]